MKTENLSKATEIELLTKLCNSDSYFSQYFGKSLDIMVSNINNDRAIEMGLPFEADITFLETRIQSLELVHKDQLAEADAKKFSEKMSLLECMLIQASELKDDRLEESVIEELGVNETIKLKRLLGIDLNSSEIDYLITKI